MKQGVLQLIFANIGNTVPGNLRIGGAGFAASAENPGGTIANLANLIVETGGTHIMTGANPIERITRLTMRGGALVQPATGQLIALDRIHAEGNVASTITTPVFIEASSGTNIDFIFVEEGSSLTCVAHVGLLVGSAFNPHLRKTGAGPLMVQATLQAAELDCQEGTVVLVAPDQAVPNGGKLF